MKKVSIVIPVYNGANYLKEAIDSALAQDYGNYEVIVVNDGSTDNGETEKIALSYGDKIRYFKKDNGGVWNTLNYGIEQSTWEYISWLSHDDLYAKDKISSQISDLRKEDDSTISFADFCYVDENWNLKGHSGKQKPGDNLLLDIFLRKYPIYGCSVLMPKMIWKLHGGFNENLRCTQDYELWLKFLETGIKFKYIPRVLCKYRRHSKQWNYEWWSLYDWVCQKEEYSLYKLYLKKIGYSMIVQGSLPTAIKIFYITHIQFFIHKAIWCISKKVRRLLKKKSQS